MIYSNIPEATVIIGRNSAYCNACGHACFYDQPGHYVLAGWTSNGRHPGCGIVWTHVTTDYSGETIAAATKNYRPDLEFIPIFP